jgi:hypothetical protein
LRCGRGSAFAFDDLVDDGRVYSGQRSQCRLVEGGIVDVPELFLKLRDVVNEANEAISPALRDERTDRLSRISACFRADADPVQPRTIGFVASAANGRFQPLPRRTHDTSDELACSYAVVAGRQARSVNVLCGSDERLQQVDVPERA